MENQKSSVNTKATTVDEINIGPIGNTNLDDKTVSDIDFPELEPCSECNNDILTFPFREFIQLCCGHIFHRLCAEKKLMLNVPNPCPFPDYSPLSQSSRTSALTSTMSERFILTSSPMCMEGVENIGTQQMGSQLRCVKCSEDLSLYLPPLGFLQTFPRPPPKPLVYLTCKHIVHYNCIDNPGKLCPICSSTDMEIDDDDMVGVTQESSTAQKKCTQKSSTEKSSSKKRKTSNKDDVSTVLKKLIEELLTLILELKPSCGKDRANALVKEEVRKQIPETKFSDDTLRKRMKRAGKVYKLFNSIGKIK
ncbi:hypothetical protein RhiirB3_530512 [Rhizophagus irregularis]|nr:hypothetical protein RhiirB3_530512 [Rhizophagus irregularis]